MTKFSLTQQSFPRLWTFFQRLFADENLKLEAIRSIVHSCDLLVDLGCSTGLMAPSYISEFGCEYIGLDIDEAALRVARERYPSLKFLNKSLAEIGSEFDGRSEPVVVLSNSLHHMSEGEVDSLLDDLSVLRQGTRVVLLGPEARKDGYSLIFRIFYVLERGRFRRNLVDVINLLTERDFKVDRCFEFSSQAPIWPFSKTGRGWAVSFRL